MKNYGWRNALMDIWRSALMPILYIIAFGFLLASAVLGSLPCGLCEGGPL